MPVEFTIQTLSPASPPPVTPNLILVGRRARLSGPTLTALLPAEVAPLFPRVVEALAPGDGGDTTTLWAPGEGTGTRRVVAAALPESCSRHNSPARPHAVASLVSRSARRRGDLTIVTALEHPDHAVATACAVARAFPAFSRKTGTESGAQRRVALYLSSEAPIPDAVLDRAARAAHAVRLAARLTDAPTEELTTDAFVSAARDEAAAVGASIQVLRGAALAEAGLGGLFGVGRAAEHPPALVILSHEPPGTEGQAALCWVGKGIVYDTGGLSLKGKTDMPGMKTDMGGAAAVLAAFGAAVRGGYPGRLHALLCLAENAVGPRAVRPDDILTLFSGKTVEINNTDAEGRLVLADGVAWAVKHLKPEVIVDLATLTGAQLVATGKRHAAVICNDDALEARAVAAGQRSGDLVHPLPYCPEFYRGEFKSQVADLRNSVKDRANAQSSCAAQFVAEHLGDFKGPWLHVDLAGPAVAEDRATGFGVALLLELFNA